MLLAATGWCQDAEYFFLHPILLPVKQHFVLESRLKWAMEERRIIGIEADLVVEEETEGSAEDLEQEAAAGKWQSMSRMTDFRHR